jgi:hypothetical protein
MKPHTYFRILSILLLAGALPGCQEVINLDLKTMAPKLVIEGSVSTQSSQCTVYLSRTTDYFTPLKSNPETGATVVISDNLGHSQTLKETMPGTYYCTRLKGNPGCTYTLLVDAGGNKYTANSVMQDSVSIDSLMQPPGPDVYDYPNNLLNYSVLMSFLDPPSQGNYYGMRMYKNGRLVRDLTRDPLISDRLSNGLYQNPTLSDIALRPGDTVRVDLVALDKPGYDFYNTLQHAFHSGTGSPFSSPAENPISNISNGAIGYFGAYAVTSKMVVLR